MTHEIPIDKQSAEQNEAGEDAREEKLVDDALKRAGLLPLPDASPTDAQAPGA